MRRKVYIKRSARSFPFYDHDELLKGMSSVQECKITVLKIDRMRNLAMKGLLGTRFRRRTVT